MASPWGWCESEGVTAWWGEARLFTYRLKVYVFAVDDLLVDAGSWSLRKPFWAFFEGRLPHQVALTHLHEDHCGNAAALASRGVRILAPRVSLGLGPVEPRLPLYRRLIWGRRPAFPAEPLPERLETERHAFRVLAGPGHTTDHVLFHEVSRGWLFTGDFFLTATPRVIFKDEDLRITLETLQRLSTLDFGTLFDTHQGPLENGPALLRRKRDYLLELKDRVAALRAKGLPDEAIDRRLFPQKPLITRVSRGEWSSLHMVRTLR